jgi:hypothetical protein
MIYKNYKSLLEDIQSKNYKRIIVSGPQRSGTTFLSQVLSEDLGFVKKDQNFNEVGHISNLIKFPVPYVAQAPHLSWELHHIDIPETFVIFCTRNCNDVIDSARKKLSLTNDRTKNWNNSHFGNIGELIRLKTYIKQKQVPDYYSDVHSCYIKNNLWLSYQYVNMKVDHGTMPYECLKDHPKFISDKKIRSKIGPEDIVPHEE